MEPVIRPEHSPLLLLYFVMNDWVRVLGAKLGKRSEGMCKKLDHFGFVSLLPSSPQDCVFLKTFELRSINTIFALTFDSKNICIEL